MISYDDFSKLDLRVGKILLVEDIESSDKLLKLKVDLGQSLGERILVAGIKKYYAPEELLGQLVIVLANLEPRELLGIKSEGMILCANSEQGPVLLVPLRQVWPGAQIK